MSFFKEIELGQCNDVLTITKTIRGTCREKEYKELRIKVLTVCSYYVTYSSQSEPVPYSCLNFKELLAQNRHDIWNLSDWNRTRTCKHLVRNRNLNHLAKLTSLAKFLSVRLGTKWLRVRALLQSLTISSRKWLTKLCCFYKIRKITEFHLI